MRIDVMTDIETLGTESDSTIIQIAAIAFDMDTGEYLNTFNQIADIEKNKAMKVDGSTIKWWLNTNKELLQELLNKGEQSSQKILENFQVWLNTLRLSSPKLHGYEIYLWGNGILFDNKMIQHQFENIGLAYPIHYKNDRDVRTVVDLACAKLGISEKELKSKFDDDTLVPHDAFDDVRYQISLVRSCYNLLTK